MIAVCVDIVTGLNRNGQRKGTVSGQKRRVYRFMPVSQRAATTRPKKPKTGKRSKSLPKIRVSLMADRHSAPVAHQPWCTSPPRKIRIRSSLLVKGRGLNVIRSRRISGSRKLRRNGNCLPAPKPQTRLFQFSKGTHCCRPRRLPPSLTQLALPTG